MCLKVKLKSEAQGVRVRVFMLLPCANVHVAYARVCSCCLRLRARVFMLLTCACVHVAYVRLCSC